MTTHTIDATNKTLGRVASQAATLLMGKDMASFEKNKVAGSKVLIENASKMKVTTKKLEQKTYTRYTGYPGGLLKESMKNLVARRGYKEALSNAVLGMLPKNKLRAKFIKNLTVKE